MVDFLLFTYAAMQTVTLPPILQDCAAVIRMWIRETSDFKTHIVNINPWKLFTGYDPWKQSRIMWQELEVKYAGE